VDAWMDVAESVWCLDRCMNGCVGRCVGVYVEWMCQ